MITPDQIKAARQAARLTQREAAEKIQVSTRAWQQWEGGQRKMSETMWNYFKVQTNGS